MANNTNDLLQMKTLANAGGEAEEAKNEGKYFTR
jgi:hypothetical protein